MIPPGLPGLLGSNTLGSNKKVGAGDTPRREYLQVPQVPFPDSDARIDKWRASDCRFAATKLTACVALHGKLGQFDFEWRLPAFLAMFGDHIGENPATYKKTCG